MPNQNTAIAGRCAGPGSRAFDGTDGYGTIDLCQLGRGQAAGERHQRVRPLSKFTMHLIGIFCMPRLVCANDIEADQIGGSPRGYQWSLMPLAAALGSSD